MEWQLYESVCFCDWYKSVIVTKTIKEIGILILFTTCLRMYEKQQKHKFVVGHIENIWQKNVAYRSFYALNFILVYGGEMILCI